MNGWWRPVTQDRAEDLSLAERHEYRDPYTPAEYAAIARLAEAQSVDCLRYHCSHCGSEPGQPCDLDDIEPGDWWTTEHQARRDLAARVAGMGGAA